MHVKPFTGTHIYHTWITAFTKCGYEYGDFGRDGDLGVNSKIMYKENK